jgi:hypothetical protein
MRAGRAGSPLHAGRAPLSGAHGVRTLPTLFVIAPVVIYERVTVTDKFHNAMIAPFIGSGAWLQSLHKRLKNEEADTDSLEEEENCVKLMIALVSRDRSSHQACEIKRATNEICRSQGKKMRHAF